MRNIFSVAVLASLSFAALPADTDACGMPDPTVFKIADTFGRGERRFVVTGGEVTGAPRWALIAPGTYDATSIAPAPRLEGAMTITLLGKSGTRVISSRDQVFIRNSFAHSAPSTAVEIEAQRGEFSFALAGNFRTAAWHELENRQRTAADLSWITAQHLEPLSSEYVTVDHIAGTELDLVTTLTKDKQITVIRNKAGAVQAQFDGYPMGAFSLYGMTYVVATSGRDKVWAELVY